jgi:hypothetical protein
MGIAVYPRLDALLRERDLSVAELERRIEQRFGLRVDPKTLYRLTHADPVQRADLEIAGAAAKILGVGLDDIFEVQASPVDVRDPQFDLTPEESRRMSALLDKQGLSGLSPDEQGELEHLLSEFGRRLHERRLRSIAQKRGVSVEQARQDVARELDEAGKWWADFESDPENRRKLARSMRNRRKRSGE